MLCSLHLHSENTLCELALEASEALKKCNSLVSCRCTLAVMAAALGGLYGVRQEVKHVDLLKLRACSWGITRTTVFMPQLGKRNPQEKLIAPIHV